MNAKRRNFIQRSVFCMPYTITRVISFDYTPRGSLVERFDPRAQIIAYLAFTSGALLVNNPFALGGFVALAGLVSVLARLRWRETKQAWLALAGVVVVFTALNLITGRGAEYALVNALRLLALFLSTIVIMRAINPAEYGVLWHGLGAPDRLAYTMNLMMRYVPTLSRDFAQTMDAQRARGLELDKPKGGALERARRFAPLIIPVVVRSVLDSSDVADAIDMRSFGAVPRRTWLRELHFAPKDFVLIAFSILFLAACVALTLWMK
jgi:energy-coupling factor transport system permease protein